MSAFELNLASPQLKKPFSSRGTKRVKQFLKRANQAEMEYPIHNVEASRKHSQRLSVQKGVTYLNLFDHALLIVLLGGNE